MVLLYLVSCFRLLMCPVSCFHLLQLSVDTAVESPPSAEAPLPTSAASPTDSLSTASEFDALVAKYSEPSADDLSQVRKTEHVLSC